MDYKYDINDTFAHSESVETDVVEVNTADKDISEGTTFNCIVYN